MNYPIPILLYHRIDHSPLSTSTTPEVFRQHMQWLQQDGWTSLTAAEFTYLLCGARPAPAKSFLITFDDGYESIRSSALEILRECEFKAISFLSTRFLRAALHGEAQENVAHPEHYLSWDQARELQSGGVIDCQSHSHAHVNFSGCALEEIRQDLGTSLDVLAAELRLPRSHFSHLAWPWGLSCPDWRHAATGLGFRYQYLVSRQAARSACAPERIPRTCFDAVPLQQFQRQLRLQTGRFASAWDLAYPLGRKLRQLSFRLLKASA